MAISINSESNCSFRLDLSRWSQFWLAKQWRLQPVANSTMIEINGVRGFLIPGDVEFLFNLAVSLPENARYLEVGSWMGLSAIVVANGLIAGLKFRSQIFCVDTWHGSPEHRSLAEIRTECLFDTFNRNISNARVAGLVTPIRLESQIAASTWSGPLLDAIFIDGDHSVDACYNDICAWTKHLKKGGRIFGHDAVPGGPVEQAVFRYCRESRREFRIHPLPQCHFMWEIATTESPLA